MGIKCRNLKICLAVIVIFLLTSCSRLNEKPEVIRIAYHSNFGGASAVTAAMEQKYFEKEGLEVELLEFASGPPAIAALEAGDIDISFLGHGAFSYVIEGKVQVLAVDSLSNAEEIMTRADSGIKEPNDLIGKTVAVQFGTSSENFLKAALTAFEIPQEQVKILNMDTAGAAMALIKGKVDAVSIWAPYTNEVREKLGNNAVTVIDCMDFRDTLALPMSWVASEDYIEENRTIVEKFVRALYAGMDYRNRNLDKTAELVANKLKLEADTIKPDVNTAVWFDTQSALLYARDGSFLKWYKELESFMKKELGLESVCTAEEYLRLDIIECALDKEGI